MLGWVICREEGRQVRPRTQVLTVCGLPLLTVELAAPRSRWGMRRAVRALERLASEGVRRVVVQGPLPQELLRAAGLRAVECAPLRRALLPRLLDWAEQVWELPLRQGTVGLRAERTDEETCRTALLLARRARYLLTDTGPGQAALEAELLRRCGVGGAPAGEAALWVSLGGAVPGPALYLGEREVCRQRLQLSASRLPEGEEMLFSALYAAGKLTIGEITIKSVEFCA